MSIGIIKAMNDCKDYQKQIAYLQNHVCFVKIVILIQKSYTCWLEIHWKFQYFNTIFYYANIMVVWISYTMAIFDTCLFSKC